MNHQTIFSTFRDPFFIPLKKLHERHALPIQFELLSKTNQPHALCKLAAEDLQKHLLEQTQWSHNFGINDNKEGTIIGKMFGVLIVQNKDGQLGYLAAFSGKLAEQNHLDKFVPPIYDSLSPEGFLNEGMNEINYLNKRIKVLKEQEPTGAYELQINSLSSTRKTLSASLQNQLFSQYSFLNRVGIEKSLIELFSNAAYKNPPSGAGECAGPKLLQYAFKNTMKPIAMAEFWWGLSPKSTRWIHGHYYPCCKEKCAPILKHMLSGINDDN